MKFRFFNTLLLCAVTVGAADVTKGGFGANNPESGTTAAEEAPATKPKRNSYPFYGTLASIDTAGKTFSLAGKKKPRIIAVTSETRFFKNGTGGKFADGIAGERVTGTLRKNSAGLEEAVTVRYSVAKPVKAAAN